MAMQRILTIGLCLAALLVAPAWARAGKASQPNIILIITDDQGHGDLGCHGNPIIKTPHLDRLAKLGIRLKNFYVSPVCSPTRASLMTGRYNYRTGVVDTYLGRSMMHGDESTLAERLGEAGYQTGIFGKWHLGDCYPMRAIDQGFQEALVHTGGGIGQPSDPPGNSYFDPVLHHNGKEVKRKGYCSDVFTEAALNFIGKNKAGPFFVYLAFNAPHSPYQVPDKYLRIYKDKDLSHTVFPKLGHALPGQAKQDEIARVYGMVSNIDDNVGKLLAQLEAWNLTEDTIVIFMTDNGPGGVRFNSGMLGRKGSIHEGGTRVPCFIHWPGHWAGDRDIETIAAHIDLAPTLLDACGVKTPAKVHLDGKSLRSLLEGKKKDWPDRLLFFQWHRGEVPEMFRACAVRGPKYRLEQPLGVQEGKMPNNPKFHLFDLQADPLTQKDITAEHPDVVVSMKKAYENWFKDVSATRGFDPPRIHLGAAQQNPVLLTRQDWRGPKASWTADGLGHWEVKVATAGNYDIILEFAPQATEHSAHLHIGKLKQKVTVAAQSKQVTFAGVQLPEGPARLEAFLSSQDRQSGVLYVTVCKLP